MNYLFLNTNFGLKLQGKCWKDDVVTFAAHLSITIKRLTRYKQKVVLAAMLEGKSMPSNNWKNAGAISGNINNKHNFERQLIPPPVVWCFHTRHMFWNCQCTVQFHQSVFNKDFRKSACHARICNFWRLRDMGMN